MSADELLAELDEQYRAARTGAAVHPLPRDIVSVVGPEAEAYLQGQCSQDVADLEPGSAVEAFLLSPQGKVDAYIRLIRSGDQTFVIDTDPGFGPAVVARLERFRLRTRVEVASVNGWSCVAVRGPGASGVVVGSPLFVLPAVWPGLSGLDLLGPGPVDLSDWVDSSAVVCGDEAWEALRIEAGLPVGGRDSLEGSIPAETGLVDRTVSLTKGCYTGQELVARLDARGSKVARRLCGVVAVPAPGAPGAPRAGAATGLPRAGAAVETADGAHEVGLLSSVAWSPGTGGWVALSTLHRRVEPGEQVVIRSEEVSDAGFRGEVRALPLFG